LTQNPPANEPRGVREKKEKTRNPVPDVLHVLSPADHVLRGRKERGEEGEKPAPTLEPCLGSATATLPRQRTSWATKPKRGEEGGGKKERKTVKTFLPSAKH